MASQFDIAELTRLDGIVPVNVETTAGLVREVLRLRAILDATPRPKHPQHLAWEALYPHFGERADFIVSLIAPFLREEGQPGLAEAGETSGGWDFLNSQQEGEK